MQIGEYCKHNRAFMNMEELANPSPFITTVSLASFENLNVVTASPREVSKWTNTLVQFFYLLNRSAPFWWSAWRLNDHTKIYFREKISCDEQLSHFKALNNARLIYVQNFANFGYNAMLKAPFGIHKHINIVLCAQIILWTAVRMYIKCEFIHKGARGRPHIRWCKLANCIHLCMMCARAWVRVHAKQIFDPCGGCGAVTRIIHLYHIHVVRVWYLVSPKLA